MRVLCKGFNLYNQLNNTEECVAQFLPYLMSTEDFSLFKLGHTFSVISNKNILKINCNLAKKNTLVFKYNIIELSISQNVILVLLETKELFKVLISDSIIHQLPSFIDNIDRIKIISSNYKLNIAYTEKGFLYSIPEKLNFLNLEIIDIKTGREHSLLLDKKGNIYSFGTGSRGQLGNGQLEDSSNPILVEALAGIKISKIAAGGWHSAAISNEGDLYLWGSNVNGQLGERKEVSIIGTPQVVDIPGVPEQKVLQIACGNKHTIILLENLSLYGCGWNKYKQLKNEEQEEYYSFEFIEDFTKYGMDIKILCGPWNSAIILKENNNFPQSNNNCSNTNFISCVFFFSSLI